MSDPKLIEARDRIKAILDELDIAALVYLHNAPGSLEIITKLDPSYSCVQGLPPAVRIVSTLEQYAGDVEAMQRHRAATANMVSGLATASAQNGLWLLELATIVDAKFEAEHTPLERDD